MKETNQNATFLKWTLKENKWVFFGSTAVSLLLTAILASSVFLLNEMQKVTADSVLGFLNDTKYITFLLMFVSVLFNFRYLYSKRKNDFFHSSPIKREYIFLSKFAATALTALISTVISSLTLLTIVDLGASQMLWVFFLNAFNIFFAAVCAGAMFSLFAVLETVTVNFIASSITALIAFPFSVALLIYGYINSTPFMYTNTNYFSLAFPFFTAAEYNLADEKYMLISTAIYIVISALLVFGGAIAYKKRKSETAQNRKPSPVFSVMLTACAIVMIFGVSSLCVSPKSKVVPAALTLTAIFLAVYYFAVLRKITVKRIVAVVVSWVVISLVALGVFTLASDNTKRFVQTIPNVQDVESVEMAHFSYQPYQLLNPFENSSVYSQNPAVIKDLDTIETIRSYHAFLIGKASQIDHYSSYENYLITYNMKSGEKITRYIPLYIPHEMSGTNPNDAEVREHFNAFSRIRNTSEYVISQTVGNSEDQMGGAFVTRNAPSDFPVTQIKSEDLKDFYKAYCTDVENRNNSEPVGEISFKITAVLSKDKKTIGAVKQVLEMMNSGDDKNTSIDFNSPLFKEVCVNEFNLTYYDINAISFLVSKGYLPKTELPKEANASHYVIEFDAVKKDGFLLDSDGQKVTSLKNIERAINESIPANMCMNPYLWSAKEFYEVEPIQQYINTASKLTAEEMMKTYSSSDKFKVFIIVDRSQKNFSFSQLYIVPIV